jgi:tetratricopeptide (TPR) repeat protein
MRVRYFLGLITIILSSYSRVVAQDYDIQRYDVNVQLQPAMSTAQIQAKLALINITTQGRSGQSVILKINKRAKVSAVTAEGATAQFQQKDDPRLNEIANVTVTLPKPLAPNATTTLNVAYTLEFKESTTIGFITPYEALLLPESFWVPLIHTAFLPYGPDLAPATLTITGADRSFADGARRDNQTFEQSLASQPLLLTGNYDEPLTVKAGATNVEFVYPRGLATTARKQAENLAAAINNITSYYKELLGITPLPTLRIITSGEIASYTIGNTIILNEDLFRREVLDLETIEFLARAVIRPLLAGERLPRGRGWTVMQDALPTYLAGLYFEKQYGEAGGREFFQRRLRAYAPVAAARNDGPLVLSSPFDQQYATSMFNKGPLLFRLIEQQVTREKLITLLQQQLQNKTKLLRFEELRRALTTGNKELELFFDQWFDKIVEPDLIIGVPVADAAGWKCALRNLDMGTLKVAVLAITDKGTRLTETVTVPSQGRGEVIFKTTEKIVSVELDPEKLYPQINYDNDARPVITSPITLFRDANLNFNRKEFAEAEAKLREAIKREPQNAVTRTLLVRTLVALGKLDEAKTEIEAVQKLTPLPVYALTWTNFSLGEIALAKGQRSDAVNFFRQAVTASPDIVPMRQKLIETEKAANQLPTVDESIRNFIIQLDKAIREATNPGLEPVVLKTNLNKFVRGIVTNKPENWTSEILRVDQSNADKVFVDVAVTVITADKQEQRGTAVYVLRRNNNAWRLTDIKLFNVQ